MAVYSMDKQLELTYDKEKLLYIYHNKKNGRKDILEASSIVSHEVKIPLQISVHIYSSSTGKGIAIPTTDPE